MNEKSAGAVEKILRDDIQEHIMDAFYDAGGDGTEESRLITAIDEVNRLYNLRSIKKGNLMEVMKLHYKQLEEGNRHFDMYAYVVELFQCYLDDC